MRHECSTSIRRDSRLSQIQKCRMHNIQSDPDLIEKEKYSHFNTHLFTREELPFLFKCLSEEQDEKVVYGLLGLRKILCDANM